jgi:hypothetical protein
VGQLPSPSGSSDTLVEPGQLDRDCSAALCDGLDDPRSKRFTGREYSVGQHPVIICGLMR